MNKPIFIASAELVGLNRRFNSGSCHHHPKPLILSGVFHFIGWRGKVACRPPSPDETRFAGFSKLRFFVNNPCADLPAIVGLTKLCQVLRKKWVVEIMGLVEPSVVTGASAPPTKSTKQIIR